MVKEINLLQTFILLASILGYPLGKLFAKIVPDETIHYQKWWCRLQYVAIAGVITLGLLQEEVGTTVFLFVAFIFLGIDAHSKSLRKKPARK